MATQKMTYEFEPLIFTFVLKMMCMLCLKYSLNIDKVLKGKTYVDFTYFLENYFIIIPFFEKKQHVL